MENNNDINNDHEEQTMLESNYKFKVLEIPKNLSENNYQIKPVLNEPIPKKDELSLLIMIFYSIPAFSKMSCLVILSIHAIIYYENLGANLLYISFFVALARAIEIILKPIIAHFSDNLNKRIGRRRPFMLIGMPFYAIFFVVLFNPPVNLDSFQISIFFGVFYCLFFIADTICNVPYYALGPELSTDSREREKLYIIYYIFQYFGVLFASSGPVIYNKLLKNCDCSQCEKFPLTQRTLCENQCKVSCDFSSNQSSLLYMCMIIGILYVFSIILLSFIINEKKNTISKKEKSYVVPKFFRILNNAPFMKLLIPWILDVTISTIFATMLPFFLQVIINPQKYCLRNQIDLTNEVCYTNTWLGYGISTFFIFCMISMIIWHYVVKSIGKKKAWSLYSLISIVTFSLFLLCEEGSFALLILISILNAIPAGGAYLNDVFVADIIDYDEFITGKRNEGLFTVFSTFIPKIVSIFAQSIPLTILGVIGYVNSREGGEIEQPIIISEFIKLYFIGVPIVLALISFYYKIKYPIENENKMQILRDSIILQKENYSTLVNEVDFYKIKDPIMNNYNFQVFCKTTEHYQTKAVAEHFNDLECLNMLYRGEFRDLKIKMLYAMVTCLIVSTFLFIVLFFTFGYLQIKSLSFIPILSLLILAVFFVLLILNYLRYKIIRKVHSGDITIDKEFLRLHIMAFKTTKQENEISNRQQ